MSEFRPILEKVLAFQEDGSEPLYLYRMLRSIEPGDLDLQERNPEKTWTNLRAVQISATLYVTFKDEVIQHLLDVIGIPALAPYTDRLWWAAEPYEGYSAAYERTTEKAESGVIYRRFAVADTVSVLKLFRTRKSEASRSALVREARQEFEGLMAAKKDAESPDGLLARAVKVFDRQVSDVVREALNRPLRKFFRHVYIDRDYAADNLFDALGLPRFMENAEDAWKERLARMAQVSELKTKISELEYELEKAIEDATCCWFVENCSTEALPTIEEWKKAVPAGKFFKSPFNL